MSNIKLKPISDLLDLHFFVPSYQRGYRWTSVEVTALLDDIHEFMIDSKSADDGVFYCLQPLIVYPSDDKYYVIDGQQRLTTIYLLLTYLKDLALILQKNKYSLHYETRPDSEVYLQDIDQTKAFDNVDYYHLFHAYKAIEKWFEGKDGVLKLNVLNTLTATDALGKNVKFIWYEIDPKEAIDIFTRINIGKIPLTNAELIKALFLRSDNFRSHDLSKKIAIANEWDEIERKLSNPNFWYFLSNLDHQHNYDNKIEYLLDLIAKKTKDSDKLSTFFYFNTLLGRDKQASQIDQQWLHIKDRFQLLEEWYADHTLYHYIGYLLSIGISMAEILNLSVNRNKQVFMRLIKDRIRDIFKTIVLDDLSFDKSSDKKQIHRILLLFNIETILQSKKSHIRFPFDRFKTENWDIEHINPQNPFDSLEYYQDWCLDTLDYMTGKNYSLQQLQRETNMEFDLLLEELLVDLDAEEGEVVEAIVDILNDPIEYKAKTEELAAKLFNKYRGADSNNNNHISNLALLDATTNRSYGNSLFPIKRNIIIKNDRAGIFIPIATKNVFLKYYSSKFADVMYWKESDAKAYFQHIQETLSYFLSNQQ